jgi:ATP-dependent exoDNAse (exonuclease V) alpha subunit
MSMHTKDDIKYTKNMENNEVNEGDFPIYMCAVNKKVDEINKKYFDENKNEPFEFIKKIKYYTHKKSCKKSEVKKLPVNNLSFVKEMIMRGENVVLKKDMKVMITENIDVENGICNGTTGYIIEITKENEKYVISVLTKENKKIDISNQILTIDDITIDNQIYSVTNEYIPLKQSNAITIHKSQGQNTMKK